HRGPVLRFEPGQGQGDAEVIVEIAPGGEDFSPRAKKLGGEVLRGGLPRRTGDRDEHGGGAGTREPAELEERDLGILDHQREAAGYRARSVLDDHARGAFFEGGGEVLVSVHALTLEGEEDLGRFQ